MKIKPQPRHEGNEARRHGGKATAEASLTACQPGRAKPHAPTAAKLLTDCPTVSLDLDAFQDPALKVLARQLDAELQSAEVHMRRVRTIADVMRERLTTRLQVT